MATKNVTIPKSYKGLNAVYITPSEDRLLRKTSHPKGSPQPKKGPGGLLMMDGEENRDRMFAKKHGISYSEVRAAGGSTSDKILKKVRAAPKKAAPKVHSSGPRKATPKASPKAKPRSTPKSSGGGSTVSSKKASTKYSDYVKSYPDLAKHYRDVVKKTGASMEAWGKAHWDKHGSKADKRSLGGPSGGSGAAAAGGGGGVMSIPSTFVRTRMGYDPDTSVDYTNTNPAYWNSVVSYFKQNPGGNPVTGELGIWTPNFEKQGAESTALAAIAGGVTAHVNSNYSNNTVDDATAIRLGHASIDEHGRKSTYRGGAEKAIRLNSISRGGTHIDTGRPMGGTDPIGYGAHIKGGKVIKGAMPGYLKDGGDFGGLLGVGTSITGDWLTGLLGGMDADGMRLRGTMPAPMGATSYGGEGGSGGMAGGYGGGYGGGGISGGGPVVPTYMSDWSKFMPKNFSLGEAMYDKSGAEVAPGGFLYQPHAADYRGGMSSPVGGGYGSGGGFGGGVTGGGGVSTPDYAGYVSSYPDIGAAYDKYKAGGGPRFPTAADYGRWHYDTHGSAAGRKMPTAMSASPTAGSSVTYSPPPGGGVGGGFPDPLKMAGIPGTPGTRMGMFPGSHSSHLGAYEDHTGKWVWGPSPSASGDAGETSMTPGSVAHSVSPFSTMGHIAPGSPISSVIAGMFSTPHSTLGTTVPAGTYGEEELAGLLGAMEGSSEGVGGAMGAGGMAGSSVGGMGGMGIR